MVLVPTDKLPGSTQIEGIGTTNFGARLINIVQLIMIMTDSERRSTSVPREINGQDKTTPEHVTVASVSLSALLKAKNLFYKSQNHLWMKFLLVPSHITLVPVPLPLVPGSTTFAQCCTRYHPSGTMVPLPCHPPLMCQVGKFDMRGGLIPNALLCYPRSHLRICKVCTNRTAHLLVLFVKVMYSDKRISISDWNIICAIFIPA